MYHPHSSWHQHCRTPRSNWVLKIWLLAASLQKTRIHLQQPDNEKQESTLRKTNKNLWKQSPLNIKI